MSQTTNHPDSAITQPATPATDSTTMQAVVRTRYGDPHDAFAVQTVDLPQAGADEVRVRVLASSVNTPDWAAVTGVPAILRLAAGITRPKAPIRGTDVAGIVEAVGDGVDTFTVGEEVFGSTSTGSPRRQHGAFAESVIVPAAQLASKPGSISFEEAASSVMSGLTALASMSQTVEVRPGMRALINGASGGVGTFAIQIAKARGAHVTAVTSHRNRELVRSLGADEVIDYRTEDFTETTGRYDAIIDTGGRHSIRRLRSVLAPGGTLVIVGGEGGNKLTGGFGRPIRAAMMSPFVGRSMPFFLSTEHHDVIDRLAGHLAGGEVVAAVGQEFPLEQTSEAIRRLAAGESSGKSAILVSAR